MDCRCGRHTPSLPSPSPLLSSFSRWRGGGTGWRGVQTCMQPRNHHQPTQRAPSMLSFLTNLSCCQRKHGAQQATTGALITKQTARETSRQITHVTSCTCESGSPAHRRCWVQTYVHTACGPKARTLNFMFCLFYLQHDHTPCMSRFVPVLHVSELTSRRGFSRVSCCRPLVYMEKPGWGGVDAWVAG